MTRELASIISRLKAMEERHDRFSLRVNRNMRRQDEIALREIQGRDEEVRMLAARVKTLETQSERQSLAIATLIDKVARMS